MELHYYTRRWGHGQVIHLTRNEDGWIIEGSAQHRGQCDQKGLPHLKEILELDCVHYPSALFDCMGYLWERWESLGEAAKRTALGHLSDWVILVEKSTPTSGFWSDCFVEV